MEIRKEVIAYKQAETGSSAFLLDLRNSTRTTREISWDGRLEQHFNFMLDLNHYLFSILNKHCELKDYAMNDTGDGFLCVFWDSEHPKTCLLVAAEIRNYLIKELDEHNKKLSAENELDFGIGVHSGGCTVKRLILSDKKGEFLRRDYIFGIVANTSARLESFTKKDRKHKFLISGNFKKNLLGKFKEDKAKIPQLRAVFGNEKLVEDLGRHDINDGKKKGHKIYALKDRIFSELFSIFPTESSQKI